MKHFKFIFYILLFALFISCQENSEKSVANTPEESLYNEIMQVHDEVMPLMGHIVQMTRELKSADSLQLTNSVDSIRLLRIEKLIDSENAMMDWMYQFEQEKKGDIEYLQKQKVKVDTMAAFMLRNIDKAEKTLKMLKETNNE